MEANMPKKGLLGMKFMQDAMQRKKLESEQLLKELEEELAEEEEESDDSEVESGNSEPAKRRQKSNPSLQQKV